MPRVAYFVVIELSRVMNAWRKMLGAITMLAWVCAGVFFSAPTVFAATFTGVSMEASTLEAGEVANYTLTFTTKSSTSLFHEWVWRFDSGFDLSTITEDDIDVVGYTTASACGGVDFAVTISGQDIQFQHCVFSAITPGTSITLRVGTHASESGTGVHQVENPSSVGTYYQFIGHRFAHFSSFADSASVIVPIGGDDSLAVSGTVPATGGGGGGGGGGSSDTTPPNIFNVIVSGITETSATVTWNTDENADSGLDYGLTQAYTNYLFDSSLSPSHTFTLTGLTPGTLYHFWVYSNDLASNEAVSGDFTFTTADSSAPVISNIQVVDISKTSARITWTTSEPATQLVDYGLTNTYGSNRSAAGVGTSHSVPINNLSSNTTYHFRVISQDNALNTATSADYTFTTLSDPAPGNVQNFTVSPSDGRNTLTWTNPGDQDLSGVRLLVCANGFPQGPLDGVCSLLSTARTEQYIHTGLQNGQRYYYGAFAFDAANQYASGAIASGTPIAPEIPPEEPVEPPPEEPNGEVPEAPPGAAGEFCGDGRCSVAENATSCPSDCREVLPVCGNGQCESTESATSCAVDCATEEIPTQISLENFSFFVLDGKLRLPTGEGLVRVLPGRNLRVTLEPRGIEGEIDRIEARVNGSTYLMSPLPTQTAGLLSIAALPTDVFETTFATPQNTGSYPLMVTAFKTDGTEVHTQITLSVLAEGSVYESVDGQRVPIDGARIILVDAGTGATWDASSYGQLNPITTEGSGQYAWYVPEGSYVLKVEKTGYAPFETRVQASGRIVNTPIGLVREEPVEPLPPEEEQQTPENTLATLLDAVKRANNILDTVRHLPGVQEASTSSLPVLSGAAIASTAILASSFNLLSFLQYLFTSPLLLFGRRKRKAFGVVYNAATKLPIDLATVRLFKLSEKDTDPMAPGRLLQSRVTNKKGQYAFLVQPGRYRLQITKPGFVFPSVFAAERTKDDKYLDVYHGEVIEATGNNAAISANIPVDPSGVGPLHEPAAIIWKRRLRILQRILAVGGVIVSFGIMVLQPSYVTLGIFIVQIVLYFFTKRLATPSKPNNWGIVYDEKTHKPLANAVARIFDPTYNKLLETQVTDSSGRYSFFLGPNEYYAVFQKKGYNEEEYRPIDYTKNNDTEEFGPKIKMKPASNKP